MSEQAITTVEKLPAELRAELVAKRKAGTTLAELRRRTRRWRPTSSGPCCRRCPRAPSRSLPHTSIRAAKPA
jgi:hypothetical protein